MLEKCLDEETRVLDPEDANVVRAGTGDGIVGLNPHLVRSGWGRGRCRVEWGGVRWGWSGVGRGGVGLGCDGA